MQNNAYKFNSGLLTTHHNFTSFQFIISFGSKQLAHFSWRLYQVCPSNLVIMDTESDQLDEELDKDYKRRYVDYCFKKCLRQRGVQHVIVFDCAGIPKKSTMNKTDTIQYVGLFDELICKSKRTIRGVNGTDALTVLRLKSQKYEAIITVDNDLYFMVFQNAKGKTKTKNKSNSVFLNFFGD